jgi:hypothetical protein
LTSFLSPFGDILGGIFIGYFLDMKRFSVAFKARSSFIFLMAFNLGLWYVSNPGVNSTTYLQPFTTS